MKMEHESRKVRRRPSLPFPGHPHGEQISLYESQESFAADD
jgi:hypothetical protein